VDAQDGFQGLNGLSVNIFSEKLNDRGILEHKTIDHNSDQQWQT